MSDKARKYAESENRRHYQTTPQLMQAFADRQSAEKDKKIKELESVRDNLIKDLKSVGLDVIYTGGMMTYDSDQVEEVLSLKSRYDSLVEAVKSLDAEIDEALQNTEHWPMSRISFKVKMNILSQHKPSKEQ